jgi:cyclic pyranopterin phosphate synthase
MPKHGISWTRQEHLLSDEEIVRLARLFVEMGITKIRLTGGEPLTRSSIVPIAARLKQLPNLRLLAITTNGILLSKLAVPLRDARVDSVTISLDSLREDRFAQITRRNRLQDAVAGIEAALSVGIPSVKINIVVIRGINDDEILDFVRWGKDRHLHLRFIEYMPFPGNDWTQQGVVSFAEMFDTISSHHPLVPLMSEPGSVGKDFGLRDGSATISFVTSMTESFCGTCTRLRLTADGNIKSCLFADDERMLRDVMRDGGDDAALRCIIESAVLLPNISAHKIRAT